MALLNKDGSLNAEWLNKLPYEKYMEIMGTLTEKQINEYLSAIPINESKEPVQPISVDYTLEDERSGIDADALLNNMKKKYGTK